ncbi:MAG: hypothetical protein WA954_04980 [Parerythrobacter sp.]
MRFLEEDVGQTLSSHDKLLAPGQTHDAFRIDDGVAFVPSKHCLSLPLPHQPASRRALATLVDRTAPLRASELIWTGPDTEADGTSRIVLARRDWLDAHIGELEQLGYDIKSVRTHDTGLRFDYRTPAQKRRKAITCALGAVATIVAIAAAIVLVGQAEPDIPPVKQAIAAPMPDVFQAQSLVAEVSAVSAILDPQLQLSSIARSREGALTLELRTIEPDGMREVIAQGNFLPRFVEATQKRSEQGDYVVAYRRPTIEPVASATRVDVLSASGAATAEAQVRRLLGAYAQPRVLQMNLAPPLRQQGRLLVFPIDIVGPQADVLDMTSRIEALPPPMRFAEWSISPASGGVRLSGLLYVPWHLTAS